MKNQAAVMLGTMGGKIKSEKKQNAAKLNGAKGGRPKMCHCGHGEQIHPNGLMCDFKRCRCSKFDAKHKV